MELRWIASRSAAGLYAAGAIWQGHTLLDTRLQEAIAKPARRLREAIVAMGFDADDVMRHLIPNAARVERNSQMIELTLRKLPFFRPSMVESTSLLAGCVAEIETAIDRMDPKFADKLLDQGKPLHDNWEIRGKALSHRAAQLTDSMLLVPNAEVILVPQTTGAGSAYLDYNSVSIEPTDADPLDAGPMDADSDAKLPAVVRLAWLLSQLNIDLPMFSETIPKPLLPTIAGLAMLPPSLAAAVERGLIKATPSEPCPLPLGRAIAQWDIQGPENQDGAPVDLAEVTAIWWKTYTEASIPWNAALSALFAMLCPTPQEAAHAR